MQSRTRTRTHDIFPPYTIIEVHLDKINGNLAKARLLIDQLQSNKIM